MVRGPEVSTALEEAAERRTLATVKEHFSSHARPPRPLSFG
jgi:hypothetical protein